MQPQGAAPSRAIRADSIGTMPSSTQSTAVAFMTSGGIRQSESGNKISFFIRETPEALTTADWERLKSQDASAPWRAARSTLPDNYLPPMQFANLSEYRQSDFYKNEEAATAGKVSMPGPLRRAGEALRAKIDGTVPHGWKYDQKMGRDGRYSIEASRLYVSAVTKNVCGTNISLPTREVELYELDRRGSAGIGKGQLPKEVGQITAFVPETKSTAPVHEIGNVTRKAIVNCHELGDKYLLYRSEKPTPELSPGEKRQMVIIAHGVNWRGRVDIPEGVKFTYYAPHKSALLLESVNPAHLPIHAKYSTHERGTSPTSGNVVSNVSTKHGMQEDADGSDRGTVDNLLLAKAGSPVHDAGTKVEATRHALNNTNEGAAWAAHDHDVDVLLPRQHKMPLPIGGGSLKDVLAELKNAGLLSQYDELLIFSCRTNFGRGPIHSVTNNL